MYINEKEIHMLIDTGTDTSIISNKEARKLDLGPCLEVVNIIGVGGLQRFQKYGPLNIQVGEKRISSKILVGEVPLNLLGRDILKKLRVKLICANLSDKIRPYKVQLKDPTKGPQIKQWPLSKDKLEGITEIIEKLLKEGKIEEAAWDNPWNTPIFCVKKKSGKYRLLIDFRELNKMTLKGEEIQLGIPFPAGLPEKKNITVLDIADAYFTIPLDPDFMPYPAFTLPSLNNQGPARRFQWCCLPQGWSHSPAIYQGTLRDILLPWREQHPEILLYQYMDGLLIGSDLSKKEHQKVVQNLRDMLLKWGFETPEEKLQETPPYDWMGYELEPKTWKLQKWELEIPEKPTLNQLQKILGKISWASSTIPGLKIKNLCKLMRGNMQLDSHREWTTEALEEVKYAQQKITENQGYHYYISEKEVYCKIVKDSQEINYGIYRKSKGKNKCYGLEDDH